LTDSAAPLTRRLRETVAILAIYTGLTLALTWPIAAQLTRTLPDGGDDWRFLWNLWWMKTALVDLHTNPFHTTYLYYPQGANLYIDTFAPALGVLSIPLQLLGLPLVAVYNLLALSSFVAAGYGTYLLVRYLTGRRVPAFVAGLIFAFCPYHFAHLLGHLNLVSLQWMPFYVLALVRTWEWPQPAGRRAGDTRAPAARRSPVRWAALAGVWLAITAYTEWTYALFLGLFTFWYLAWVLLVVRGEPGRRAAGVRLAVLAGVWLVLVAPVLIPMLLEARTTTFAQTSIQESNFFSADLTDVLIPSLFHPLWRVTGPVLEPHYAGRPRSERALFAGYTVLLLAVGTVWAGRRRREVQFWGGTALSAWVLSLGPSLHVWGRFDFGGIRIPLPYAALYFLPFFNIVRVPGRFMALTMLALAVLAGYGLASATARGGRLAWRAQPVNANLLAPIVGALVLLEYLAVPFPLQAWEYDQPFYHQLAQEPGQFAVLELPLAPLPIYEGYQTIHHKPMIGGYLARQPPDPFVADTPVLRYLLPATAVDDPLAAVAARTGLADLRRAGVRYALAHWSVLYGGDPAALQTKLARVFPGIPSYTLPDQEMTVFQLLP
jgi:hypothetical protein